MAAIYPGGDFQLDVDSLLQHPRRRISPTHMLTPGQRVTVTQGGVVVDGVLKAVIADAFDDAIELTIVPAGGRLSQPSTKNKRSKGMEYPNVTIIEAKERRSVKVYVEVEKDVFLVQSHGREERIHQDDPRGEMPVWQVIPIDIFKAMKTATVS